MQQPLRPPAQQSPPSGLDNLVTFRASPVPNANTTAAAQARQTVLDAIAPMRRGRPTMPSSSSSAPQRENEHDIHKFEEQWNAVRGAEVSHLVDDAWDVGPRNTKDKAKSGFGDSFDGLSKSFVESSLGKTTPTLAPSPSPIASKPVASLDVKKDAFDGLGGISWSREPSPTLAQASSNMKLAVNGFSRPLPRSSGTPRIPTTTNPLSPRIPASRTGLATYHSPTSLAAEERFPSLDDLDKGWRSPSPSEVPLIDASSQPNIKSVPASQFSPPVQRNHLLPPSIVTGGLQPAESKDKGVPPRRESRSQQVTGTAMRDGGGEPAAPIKVPTPPGRRPNAMDSTDKRQAPIGSSPTKYRPSRPALARKHRSSMSIKPTAPPQDWLTGDDTASITSPIQPPPSPVKRRTSGVFSSPARPVTSGVQGNQTQNTGSRYKQETKLPQDNKPSSDTTPRNNHAPSMRPPSQTRPSTNDVSRRRDSSSDDAEGPEDVNGRMVNNDIRKRRAKGRQSSVHDLVDLYGGGGRPPADRERTAPPSPIHEPRGRRTSGILVDLSSPPLASSHPTLLSPATIIPESRAELASRRTGSSSQGERVSPIASLGDSRDRNSRPASRASPGSSPTDRSDRPRPHSMFVFPPAKPLDSASNMGAAAGQRPSRSPRRGSISDMVDLYENLGSGSRLRDPAPTANKPTGLKVTKTPSPITSRFPAISPTGVSFPLNQTTGILIDQPQLKQKPRRSPTAASSSDSSSFALPTSQITKACDDFLSCAPRRQSVSPPKSKLVKPMPAASSPFKPAKPASLSIPIPASNITFSNTEQRTPTTETPISSPSPERPYRGVGRLIDQWQKKTEEAEASRRPGSRIPGRPIGPRTTALGKRETARGA